MHLVVSVRSSVRPSVINQGLTFERLNENKKKKKNMSKILKGPPPGGV